MRLFRKYGRASADGAVYTWIRDAALVTKAVLEEILIAGNGSSLGSTMTNYAASQAIIQQVSNPSGACMSSTRRRLH